MHGPVVFVPGFMQRGASWEQVAAKVRERYPSLLFDPRGRTFEDRVHELGDVTPEGAVAVGYSLGGRVVLHAALLEPNRYRGLVLVGTTPGIDDHAERVRRRATDEEFASWIEQTPIEDVVDRWEKQQVFATQESTLVRAQRAGRLTHDPGELASLLRTGGQGSLEPAWGRLGELSQPVLCLAGELDQRYRREARRMARLLPRGSVALVQRAGHAAHLERPGETAQAILDFLERELAAL
jgi:2-succinyl-6-hydroxy-2,4-cyclohexadiene-1-carboxylate synthase